jgi:hypothetical protein
MDRQTKLSFAQNVVAISSGREASRNSIAPRISATRPNAVPTAAKSAPTSASAEILRACDVLRDVLLREDEDFSDDEPDALVGQVSAGLVEIIDRLQSLAGLQMMFEAWSR